MKGRDYHKWWKASRIGLGYPLEAENYRELTEKLSPAGVAIVIAIHLIPDVASCEKDYLISDLEADYAPRWAAALREIGANRLADFVESSVGVDHISRITQAVPEAEIAALLQSGKSMMECQQFAAGRYFESFDFETKTELEALVDRFGESRDEELRSDIARSGDRVAEMEADGEFEENWSDAVDDKHQQQDEDQKLEELEARLGEWQAWLDRAVQEFPTGAADADIIKSLSDAHRELQRVPAERLGSEANQIRLEVAELISKYRDLFPRDVRPDREELNQLDCVRRLEKSFPPGDIAWLQSIGTLRNCRITSSILGPESTRDVEIDYAHIQGSKWEWMVPTLSLRLGQLSEPLSIPENVRAAMESLLRRDHVDLAQRITAALLKDFRDRFLPDLSTGPFRMYKPDVTDAEILNDAGDMMITIVHEPYLSGTVRTSYYFGAEWDPEHGICLEEMPSGQFVLSDL